MSASAIQLSADISDIELMLGLKKGKAECLDPLLRRHRTSLIHFLYRRVQDVGIAEELSQDVFLKIYRARDDYQPAAHFTTWLYRIATNRAINWVRDNRHQRRSRSLDQSVVPAVAQTPTPEQVLLQQENRRRVREAVAALPERQRTAVFFHKYREMEYTQIAAAMGCSVSAVKALVNRAYMTLRASLAAD
jgi:RNA polymerase sigma-70 factor (ECF subfamily)